MKAFEYPRVVKSIKLVIPNCIPMGVNKWHDLHYIKTGKYSQARKATIGKSVIAQRFQVSLKKYLCQVYLNELKEFQSCYDPCGHELFSILNTYMPKEKLYTKKGTINKKSGDVDGTPKLITDAVFSLMPDLDDAFNTGFLSVKKAGELTKVEFEIYILERQ